MLLSEKMESISGTSSMLLTGNRASGKTTLAFAYACDIATTGGNPLYICNKQKIERQPPSKVKSSSSSASSPSMEIFSRISMKYISSVKELKMLMAGLHLFDPKPAAVIIEDLSSILDPLDSISKRDAQFLDLCLVVGSFISDAISSFRTQGSTVPLLITDSCNEHAFFHVMSRVTPSTFFLTSSNTDGSSINLVYKRDFSSRDPNDIIVLYKSMHWDERDGQLLLP